MDAPAATTTRGQMCKERQASGSTSETSSSALTSSTKTSSSSSIDEENRTLTLMSPGGGDPLIFEFKPPNAEFIEIMRLAMDEFESLYPMLGQFSLHSESIYAADFDTLKQISLIFNKMAQTFVSLWKGATNPNSSASSKLLQRVINLCYNKAVDNEKALNKHYEAFSSQTYGETTFKRMELILDEIKPTSNDVFVDLGSGVGQLVAHVAGGSKVKAAYGIEIASLPANFAARLEEEFRKLMKFYGKTVRPFSLENADFLDEKYRDLITNQATIIFINNFAFQADLEAKIKTYLLQELKDGTKIISTKPYVALNKTVNERHMNDISSIMDVYEMKKCPNPCSWTSADVPYYLHVVNQEKLEKYFYFRNQVRSSESRPSSTPSSRNSHSRESSVGYREKKAVGRRSNNLFGPTTRKKWNDIVGVKNPQKVAVDVEPNDEGKKAIYEDVSSESDSSEEDKKKRKKAKDRLKALKAKEKPRKSKLTPDLKNVKSEFGHPVNGTKLSADAEEGMELMHRMTCAVNEGRFVDPNDPKSILVTGLPKKSTRNSTTNGKKTTSTLVQPLLDIMANRGSNKTPAAPKNIYSSKYPQLNCFMGELLRGFEDFLDSMQTPEFVQSITQKLNADKGKQEQSDGGQTQNATSSHLTMPNGLNVESLLQRFDRIEAKNAEVLDEMAALRKEILSLSKTAMPVKLNGMIPTTPLNVGTGNNLASNFAQPNSNTSALSKAYELRSLFGQNGMINQDLIKALTAQQLATSSYDNNLNLRNYAVGAALSSAVTPQQLSPNVHPTNNLANAIGSGFANSTNSLDTSNQFGSVQMNGLAQQHLASLYRNVSVPPQQQQSFSNSTQQLLQTASQNAGLIANPQNLLMSLMNGSQLSQLLPSNPATTFATTSSSSSFAPSYNLDAANSVSTMPTANTTTSTTTRKPRAKKSDESNRNSKSNVNLLNSSDVTHATDESTERRIKTKNKRSRSDVNNSDQKSNIQLSDFYDSSTASKRNCLDPTIGMTNVMPVEAVLTNQLAIDSRLSTSNDNKSFV
ncbi:Histone-lysine N-methyltransferase, H3 lysine-79 specific [Aphelenchoides besseyi]|nr:Histone-lysine N-methyltransferase, H3 lysine-79 specific [Aphelenchoides besseyi]KAI6225990.1 Histone-lysine N-methyltransferase, H3 lysine-79 specific [Aphelenchoides besseyi]